MTLDAVRRPGTRFTGWKAWLARALLATVVPLVALEGFLQLAAWIVSTRATRDDVARVADDGLTVLCVGDSFTYGVGASDQEHAYPARLEARLRERSGRPWVVRNGGWPGRNSRDVLRELPAQLDGFKPAAVCILVGTNDSWSHPELHLRDDWFEEAAGARFRWEWRTLRLVALVWHRLRGSGAPAPREMPAAPDADAAPLIGAWIRDGAVCRFDPDGRCWFEASERRWSNAGRRLRIDAPAGSRLEADWQVESGKLHLRVADPPAELLLEPARLRRTVVDREVTATLKEGRIDDARRRVAELRVHALDSAAAAATCLFAHAALDRGAPTVALAHELLTKFPEEVELLRMLAEQAHGIGDDATAQEAIDHAIRVAPDRDPLALAELHRFRAIVLRLSDSRAAIVSIAECFRLDGDRERAVLALRQQLGRDDPGSVAQRIGECGLDEATCRRLAALAEASDAEDGLAQVLESHLRQVIALCRSRGARPVVLSYPFRGRDEIRVFRLLSEDAELTRVSVHLEFERLLEGHAREEYFVPDGHCNDAGYDAIASLVCDALLR